MGGAGRCEINLICVDYTGTFAPNFESLYQYLKHRERQKDMAIYLLGSTWLPPVCYFKLHTLNIHFLEQRSKGIKIKWQTHIALDHHYLIPLCTATTKIKNDRTNSFGMPNGFIPYQLLSSMLLILLLEY